MSMKNSLIISIVLFFFNSSLLAQTYKFETKSLEIFENGNLIKAYDGKAISTDDDMEIEADKFEFTKELKILKTYGNSKAIIKSRNLEMNFDEGVFKSKDSTIYTKGNVIIFFDDRNFKIQTDEIFYDKKKNQIKSDVKTVIYDKLQNQHIVDSIIYELDKNLLKVTNLISIDKDGNQVKTSIAFINTRSNKMFGKDVDISLNNKSFNKENEPRLKGNSFGSDNNITEITKGVFTTCKKRDGCPPWQMSAENIKHDKKKQTIFYDNAILRLYDKPVMYFPKFFHPDPTVKRRSGFLIPTIKNSSSSTNYLNVPYFLAIAENRDATFSPRIYMDDKFLLQTEYREVNLNTKHNLDFSIFAEKDKDSKNHVFYNYVKDLNLENFDNGKFNFKMQKTSNDTYLKSNKLRSEIIPDKDILENSLGLDLYSNNLSINFETTVYENLNKNTNDRYEFILPKVSLYKKFNNNTNLNGDFSFKSQGLIRNYNTNVLEKKNINDLVFNSFPIISKTGFYNDYKLLIRNSITDSKNSSKYKEDQNIYLSGMFQYNSSFPLIKENQSHQKILKPKLTFNLAPSHTKDERNKDVRIDINNVYSMNRIADDDTIEGGLSFAYGGEYSIFDKNVSREIINLKLANNFRLDENDDLPLNNQIGQKTSNIFSEIIFNPNEFLNTKYTTSIKNNFADINYENLSLEIGNNKLITTFDYLNDNNDLNKNSYLTNTLKYTIDSSNSLSFSTRENKTEDITEYYNLMYQYNNDCLSASIEYNKDYYSDRDIKPEESIFLRLTIIPFGETNSPNLK